MPEPGENPTPVVGAEGQVVEGAVPEASGPRQSLSIPGIGPHGVRM